SKDGSADAVQDISALTHLISEPDDGIYHAMNKGIQLARGKYCLFLNAGDWLYSNTILEDTVTLLRGELVTGWLNVIYPQKFNKSPRIKRLDLQDVRKKFLFHRTLHHQATFILRSLFQDHGGYDQEYKIYGDRDFFLKVINKGARLNFIKLCIANYNFDGISSTSLGTQQDRAEIKKIRQRHFSRMYRLKRNLIDPIENLFHMRGF
ncbi:MAG: hypothetical protein D3923_03480, partial [Candidatus Electrothrix sp. AR3]|nr:hypothetical protein [Candidatus Electrothrix sp. AR3]